ncbi:MAG: MarR family transcriptional regulator [Thermoflexales bacterium]|nr:MarR family transcriptional regulator [Thermoflexales bacterium]
MTETPSPDQTRFRAAHAIFMLVGGISRLSLRGIDERLQHHHPQLAGPHLAVLGILSRHAMTLSELAARLILTPSTLVPVIDRLEEQGLIARQKDPHDRRRTPLSVTPAGELILRDVPMADAHAGLIDALDKMGTERVQALQTLLLDLLRHLDPSGRLHGECSAMATVSNTAELPKTPSS